jgi:ketosteroid isomerase-like protein
MIRTCLAVSLLLVVCWPASGAAQINNGQLTSDQDAVRRVEEQIAAALSKNDADALEHLWGADYTFVNPDGQLLTKAKRLDLLRSGNFKYESYSRDDEKIHVYGTTAVVRYRSTVTAHKGALKIASQRRVITVLVKSDAGWQAVAQQSTRIVGGPEPAK